MKMSFGDRIRGRLIPCDRIELHYYPGKVTLRGEDPICVRCETGYYRGNDDSNIHIFREFVHTDEKSLCYRRGPIVVRSLSSIEKIVILTKSGRIARAKLKNRKNH